MKKRKSKCIIQNGIEMYYCPDCDDYRLYEEMIPNKSKKSGVNTYCKFHNNIRKKKLRKRKRKWQIEKYEFVHGPGNEFKYYFKNYEPKHFDGPTVNGVCVTWGIPRYETRCGE